MDKPAYKTVAFWATVVLTSVGFLMGSGLIVEGSTVYQVVGWLVTILSALGYKAWGPVTIAQAEKTLALRSGADR